MDGSELKQSQFNSGVAIVIRLNNLWDACNKAYNAGEFMKWNALLDTLYLETCDDVEEADEKEYNRINFLCLKNKYHPFWITRKHIFVKKLHKSQGVGKKYIDEDEYDFA
jgi:hypothetical protein